MAVATGEDQMSARNSACISKARLSALAGHPYGRMSRALIAGAVTLTATAMTAPAIALAGPAPGGLAQQPAAASWNIVRTVHARGGPLVTAVTALGARDAWAFEQGGLPSARPAAFRLSGTTWKRAPFPGRAGESVPAADSSSPANVWAVTSKLASSRALRWNGSRWQATGTLPTLIDDVVVISQTDVWAFSQPGLRGSGAWHFNGHHWLRQAAGHGLSAGSALSAHSIWAVDGKTVAHWNGMRWTRTSVARLLPPAGQLSSPRLTAIFASSASSVWAVGTGGREDEGGPAVVLHFNGHRWSRAALDASAGDPALAQVAPDGQAGLWITVPSADGIPFGMLRFSAGHLSSVTMPVSGRKLDVLAVAAHGGTAFSVGFTHVQDNIGVRVAGVILKFS
jgi:hypothetical protein